MTTPVKQPQTFKTTTEWYNALNVYNKYRFPDENKLHADITSSADFLDLVESRTYFSRNILRNFLKQKSRVVMFGAGGTASWFLPKLLKIYNDAFTKCAEDAYPLEIIIIDGDTVEAKNVIRQNFINKDIGEHKALRLAERYTDLYPNISVTAIPMYATSNTYDTVVSKIDPLSSEHFFDIDSYMRSNDVIVNLVDNESFKRKLDYVIYRTNALAYFNAGINLYNGQCYVAYPHHTNLYTLDHASFIEDSEEVSIHSCADADAEGAADNPEQMFNGNDLAASILANLFQSSISEIIHHRKIKFTCGGNISITKDLPTYAGYTFAVALKSSTLDSDYPFEAADDFIKVHGTKLASKEAKEHYLVHKSIGVYQKMVEIISNAAVIS